MAREQVLSEPIEHRCYPVPSRVPESTQEVSDAHFSAQK